MMKYGYNMFTNRMSKQNLVCEDYSIAFSFVDYDDDSLPDDVEPYLEIICPKNIPNIQYLPIAFGEQPERCDAFVMRHVGCLDIDHKKKELRVFDPDGNMSYFDSVIQNSPIFTNISSEYFCEKLLQKYANDVGYKYQWYQFNFKVNHFFTILFKT